MKKKENEKKKKNLANTQALNKLHHINSTQNVYITASRLHIQQLPNNVYSAGENNFSLVRIIIIPDMCVFFMFNLYNEYTYATNSGLIFKIRIFN